MHTRTSLAAAVATALSVSLTLAPVSAQTAMAELPAAQRFGDVTVVNGGVDLDEADLMLEQLEAQTHVVSCIGVG